MSEQNREVKQRTWEKLEQLNVHILKKNEENQEYPPKRSYRQRKQVAEKRDNNDEGSRQKEGTVKEEKVLIKKD